MIPSCSFVISSRAEKWEPKKNGDMIHVHIYMTPYDVWKNNL